MCVCVCVSVCARICVGLLPAVLAYARILQAAMHPPSIVAIIQQTPHACAHTLNTDLQALRQLAVTLFAVPPMEPCSSGSSACSSRENISSSSYAAPRNRVYSWKSVGKKQIARYCSVCPAHNLLHRISAASAHLLASLLFSNYKQNPFASLKHRRAVIASSASKCLSQLSRP